MAALMKKMASSSSENEYDYDYGYESDYAYDYGYEYALDNYDYDYSLTLASDDYDYEYVDDSAPSPMAAIIQGMMQQKLLAARKPAVEISVKPKTVQPLATKDASVKKDVSTFGEHDSTSKPAKKEDVEISQPPRRANTDKETRPSDQVSYRTAP